MIEGGSTNLKDLKAGSYKFDKFCMEPTSFTVKEESQFKDGGSEFVKTKLMTRLTYTLDAVSTSRWPSGALLQYAHICSAKTCRAGDLGRTAHVGAAGDQTA